MFLDKETIGRWASARPRLHEGELSVLRCFVEILSDRTVWDLNCCRSDVNSGRKVRSPSPSHSGKGRLSSGCNRSLEEYV